MVIRCCVWLALMAIAGTAIGGQNIVVILDDSGSMQDRMRANRQVRKIDAAKQSLLAVLNKLPADAQIGVVVLNGAQQPWIIPFGPLDKSRLDTALQAIRAKGGTPLGKYMKVGADALLEARAKQHYGTYKLLIVTDGEAGDGALVERYLPEIISRGLVVDVIGVDMDRDHSLANNVHTYRRADDPASLEQAISQVVLGESTADSMVAGQSDFDLLAPLPSEVATAALAALVEPGNSPIGSVQASPVSTRRPGGAQGGGRQTGPPPANVPSPQRTGGAGGIVLMVFGFACAGVFGLLLLVVIVMSQQKARRR